MLDINIKKESEGMSILSLSGDFDLFEKEHVLDLLPQLLSDNPKGLIIDLSDISLLDSGGVETLIIYHNTVKDAGALMALVVNRNNYLMRKFRNLGVFGGTGINVFGTIEEARAAIERL